MDSGFTKKKMPFLSYRMLEWHEHHRAADIEYCVSKSGFSLDKAESLQCFLWWKHAQKMKCETERGREGKLGTLELLLHVCLTNSWLDCTVVSLNQTFVFVCETYTFLFQSLRCKVYVKNQTGLKDWQEKNRFFRTLLVFRTPSSDFQKGVVKLEGRCFSLMILRLQSCVKKGLKNICQLFHASSIAVVNAWKREQPR